MIEIPFESLPENTLQALIESFVLREGTDYGEYEVNLEQKVSSVHEQLMQGKLKIVFDESEETCTILTKEELFKLLSHRD